jgi:hypothetical protein
MTRRDQARRLVVAEERLALWFSLIAVAHDASRAQPTRQRQRQQRSHLIAQITTCVCLDVLLLKVDRIVARVQQVIARAQHKRELRPAERWPLQRKGVQQPIRANSQLIYEW